MSDKAQPAEMPPGFPELWEGVSRARMDIAELKGMIKMHFKDAVLHMPPCATASGLQKTLHTATGDMRRRNGAVFRDVSKGSRAGRSPSARAAPAAKWPPCAYKGGRCGGSCRFVTRVKTVNFYKLQKLPRCREKCRARLDFRPRKML